MKSDGEHDLIARKGRPRLTIKHRMVQAGTQQSLQYLYMTFQAMPVKCPAISKHASVEREVVCQIEI